MPTVPKFDDFTQDVQLLVVANERHHVLREKNYKA